MRKFVNFYLILFLVDGLLSLVNSLGGRLGGIQPLSVVQALAAFVVLLTSFVLYFLMGCMRGFPKRIVLPLIVLTVWVGFFAALPLPIFMGMKNMMVVLSLLQTGMGIGALILLRVSGAVPISMPFLSRACSPRCAAAATRGGLWWFWSLTAG